MTGKALKLRRIAIPGLVGLVSSVLIATGVSSAAYADTTEHGAGGLHSQVSLAPQAVADPAALPTSVDLTQWAVTPGNQMSVDSCTTWAVGRSLIGWHAIKNGAPESTFAPMYIYSQTNEGLDDNPPIDGGGLVDKALDVAAYQGVDTAAHYTQGDTNWQDPPTEAERANAANYRLTGWKSLFSGNAGVASRLAIQQALADGNPVVVGLPIRQGFDALSPTNTLDTDITSTSRGGHAVLAVGYNSDGLLLENSWGTGWGTNGFGRIGWNVVENDVYEGYIATGWGVGAAPSVATAAATENDNTTVTISGTVDIPEATVPAKVTVEYGTTDHYGTSKTFTYTAGGAGVGYSETITGLAPQQTYHYKVTVTTPAGTDTTGDRTFFTALMPGPPLIASIGSGALSGNGQWVLGSVNMFTDQTGTETVKWGRTSDYDHNLPTEDLNGSLAGDGAYKDVIGGQILGLDPGVYHYAVTVTTAHGSTTSADRLFIVPGPPVINTFATGALSGDGNQWTLGNVNLLTDSSGTQTVKWGTTAVYDHNLPTQNLTGTQQADGTYKSNIGGQILGLTPGVTYHYAVTVTTSHGSTTSADKTFIASGAPVINTFATGALSGDGNQWTLGNVNLITQSTGTATVKWGTTSAYGSSLAPQTLNGSLKSDGTYGAIIGGQLHGLTPGVTYHYAVTVTTSSGSTTSTDQTFVASPQ